MLTSRRSHTKSRLKKCRFSFIYVPLNVDAISTFAIGRSSTEVVVEAESTAILSVTEPSRNATVTTSAVTDSNVHARKLSLGGYKSPIKKQVSQPGRGNKTPSFRSSTQQQKFFHMAQLVYKEIMVKLVQILKGKVKFQLPSTDGIFIRLL